MISTRVLSWLDTRREKSIDHSVHDVFMSGLACMYFQEPSLLQFQTEMESKYQQNNLRTLFDVKNIPSYNVIKEVLDEQDSGQFQRISKDIVQQLQKKQTTHSIPIISRFNNFLNRCHTISQLGKSAL